MMNLLSGALRIPRGPCESGIFNVISWNVKAQYVQPCSTCAFNHRSQKAITCNNAMPSLKWGTKTLFPKGAVQKLLR